MMSGRLLNVQYQAVIEQFLQPVFVTGPMTRLGDAVAILAEHNYGERHLFGAREDGRQAGIVVGRGRQGIGIENHFQSSRSICSNASSTRFSICWRSLCRCLSLPTCFIQGFSWDVVLNFSWTASVTSWRRGMPRWAAADFARRKRKSGISRVVFTDPYYHIYGTRCEISHLYREYGGGPAGLVRCAGFSALFRLQPGRDWDRPYVGVAAEPSPVFETIEILLRLVGCVRKIRRQRTITAEI